MTKIMFFFKNRIKFQNIYVILFSVQMIFYEKSQPNSIKSCEFG